MESLQSEVLQLRKENELLKAKLEIVLFSSRQSAKDAQEFFDVIDKALHADCKDFKSVLEPIHTKHYYVYSFAKDN